MGAYRSKPITDKVSSDDSGKYVKCGASSMQGWRVTQEDAHNCIIEYDENTSFFAVYDGHGSHEVAEYCSQKLPDYLKDCASYKNGEYSQALKDAFLGFDATLVNPEVVKVLKQIAKDEKEETENNQNSGSEDEENIRNLYEEAQMPLEEVMAKYQADGVNVQVKKLPGVTPPSPYVVAKQASKFKASAEAGSSKAGGSCSSAGCSSSNSDISEDSSIQSTEEKSSGDGENDLKPVVTSDGESLDELPGTSKKTNGEKNDSEVSKCSENEIKIDDSTNKENIKNDSSSKEEKVDVNDTSVDKSEAASDEKAMEEKGNKDKVLKEENEVPDVDKDNKDSPVKLEVNGEVQKEEESKKEPHENGDVANEDTEEEEEGKDADKLIKTLKGKGKAILKKLESPKRQSARQRSVAILFRSLFAAQSADSDSDDEDDDEGDESFQGADDSSSDDDDDDDDEEKDGPTEEGDEEEEETEEEGEEEEEELEDNDDRKWPGVESGCTAVVAVLHGRDLYVANAGDSRCVVSRNGEALDMSLDHKPEDATEIQRIVAAGGYVSRDGRVKGGLNLSRAIGDHTYKTTENLPPEEQMITALPDVRTLSLDPKQDEFMILACDGIWNSMTSQEVVSFIRTRLQNGDKKLSTICEELFDYCLAPNTFIDESGCDNMTAVIIQFLPSLMDASSCNLPNTSLPNTSNKRPASPVEESENAAKRIKKEGE